MTHLSLFSGIGGLDLAAEMAGIKTVGQCEWADYQTSILERHWPDVPRWRDIRTLNKESFYEKTGLRTVDIISGGFPCQPFSIAGKRCGKDDDRYLWPEMLRVIREIRPTWVLGENVPGIINLALDTVLADLENEGYETQAFVVPACGVDAPHRRERVCIVAHRQMEEQSDRRGRGPDSMEDPDSSGCREPELLSQQQRGAELIRDGSDVPDPDSAGLQRVEQHGTSDGYGRRSEAQGPACKLCEAVPDADEIRRDMRRLERERVQRRQQARNETDSSCEAVSDAKSTERDWHEQRAEPAGISGFADGSWWPTEPDVGRVAHGVPNRVDRIKCLGNAVVPQQFYIFFKAIADIERATHHEEPGD